MNRLRSTYAPTGFVPLFDAIDLVGRAVYCDAWTGEEVKSPRRERYADQPQYLATLGTLLRETNPELDEADALACLREIDKECAAPRMRRDQVTEKLRAWLLEGSIAACSFDRQSGDASDIPPSHWRGTDCLKTFETGTLRGQYVLVHREQVESVLAGRRTDGSAAAKIAHLERPCREWLEGLMKANPKGQTEGKARYFRQAQREFDGITKNMFNKAWGKAVSNTGAKGWSKSGPK